LYLGCIILNQNLWSYRMASQQFEARECAKQDF